ncbi:MAG: hypothetical protein Kow0069_05650 [Promethearchaeota archaeon]
MRCGKVTRQPTPAERWAFPKRCRLVSMGLFAGDLDALLYREFDPKNLALQKNFVEIAAERARRPGVTPVQADFLKELATSPGLQPPPPALGDYPECRRCGARCCQSSIVGLFPSEPCPFLEGGGSCSAYEARPEVCRHYSCREVSKRWEHAAWRRAKEEVVSPPRNKTYRRENNALG